MGIKKNAYPLAFFIKELYGQPSKQIIKMLILKKIGKQLGMDVPLILLEFKMSKNLSRNPKQ